MLFRSCEGGSFSSGFDESHGATLETKTPVLWAREGGQGHGTAMGMGRLRDVARRRATGVTDRDGIYLAANYRYLHGMRYEDDRLGLTLETDGAGLLTQSVRSPVPITLDRWSSTSG